MTNVQAVMEHCQQKCLHEIETDGCWGDAQLHAQFVAHLLGVAIRVLVMPESSIARFHEGLVHVFNGRGGNQKVRFSLLLLCCILSAVNSTSGHMFYVARIALHLSCVDGSFCL
jgi:hypothetical protein